DQIGDRRSFEIGIDFRGDALELAERLDLLQPGVEIARVGATDGRLGFGPRTFPSTARRADRDAHIHAPSPLCCLDGWPKSSGARSKKPGTSAGLEWLGCDSRSDARHHALEAQEMGERPKLAALVVAEAHDQRIAGRLEALDVHLAHVDRG